MTHVSRFLLILLLTPGGTLWAQDKPSPPDPLVVREKVREWVRTQQLISEEQEEWQAEKAVLADLNDLRNKEIAQLDELITAAGSRLSDASEQKEALLNEEEELRTTRNELSLAIDDLQSKTLELTAFFPAPLITKTEAAIFTLKDSKDAELQDRYRDVLSILREAVLFQNRFTLDTELRDINGQSVEVQVLYLGLSQAYFVDREGLTAGVGKPGEDGWIWTENKALAASIRETVSVYEKSAAPKLVRLPLEIDE